MGDGSWFQVLPCGVKGVLMEMVHVCVCGWSRVGLEVPEGLDVADGEVLHGLSVRGVVCGKCGGGLRWEFVRDAVGRLLVWDECWPWEKKRKIRRYVW